MKNSLFIIALGLIIIWAICFFAYGATDIIHILLPIAVTAITLGIISKKEL